VPRSAASAAGAFCVLDGTVRLAQDVVNPQAKEIRRSVPDNPRMAYHTQKHPDELRAAIAAASERGLSGTQITAQLASGTLDGWDGRYEIPADTVRHYAREAKNDKLAREGSPSLEQGLGAALHKMAGRIFTEIERQFDAAMKGQKSVPLETLDDMAKTLKTLEALAKHKPSSAPRKTVDDAPADPILAAAAEMNR
jgi:hypothetical protein